MADRIRNIQEKIRAKIQNGDEFLAVLSYLPIIGWIIVKFKNNKKDKLVQFHLEQGKEINIYIITIYFIIWFIENFPLTSWLFGKDKIFFPLIETIWLISLFLYILITIVGIYKSLNDEIWSYPYREQLNQKIKEIFQQIKQ